MPLCLYGETVTWFLINPSMASMISSSSTSPPSKMAALRLPISLTISSNSPARRKRFRVNSLRPLLHKSLIFPPNSLSKPLPTRIFPITCHSKATHDHHHDHDQDHDHGHRHQHHHCGHHDHNGGEFKLTKSQKAFADFAKAVKWTQLADFLREHLELCCFSTALFLAAAACPYLVPKASAKLTQQLLVLLAFPLVGVIISFCFLLIYIFSLHHSCWLELWTLNYDKLLALIL